jgi:hypothetical protein
MTVLWSQGCDFHYLHHDPETYSPDDHLHDNYCCQDHCGIHYYAVPAACGFPERIFPDPNIGSVLSRRLVPGSDFVMSFRLLENDSSFVQYLLDCDFDFGSYFSSA